MKLTAIQWFNLLLFVSIGVSIYVWRITGRFIGYDYKIPEISILVSTLFGILILYLFFGKKIDEIRTEDRQRDKISIYEKLTIIFVLALFFFANPVSLSFRYAKYLASKDSPITYVECRLIKLGRSLPNRISGNYIDIEFKNRSERIRHIKYSRFRNIKTVKLELKKSLWESYKVIKVHPLD